MQNKEYKLFKPDMQCPGYRIRKAERRIKNTGFSNWIQYAGRRRIQKTERRRKNTSFINWIQYAGCRIRKHNTECRMLDTT
jgi:hypothetical protein